MIRLAYAIETLDILRASMGGRSRILFRSSDNFPGLRSEQPKTTIRCSGNLFPRGNELKQRSILNGV